MRSAVSASSGAGSRSRMIVAQPSHHRRLGIPEVSSLRRGMSGAIHASCTFTRRCTILYPRV
eukprot:492710-Prorocentrum_lima.AAC.1